MFTNLIPIEYQLYVWLGFSKFQVNYPPHAHDAEEWYLVLSGNPQWFVNGEKFTAKPGDFIHHPPKATHSMVNIFVWNSEFVLNCFEFVLILFWLVLILRLFWFCFDFVVILSKFFFDFYWICFELFWICFSGNLWPTPFSPLDENWWIRWCILVCRWKPSSSLWWLKYEAIWFFPVRIFEEF